jgi:hypothetical protein
MGLTGLPLAMAGDVPESATRTATDNKADFATRMNNFPERRRTGPHHAPRGIGEDGACGLKST